LAFNNVYFGGKTGRQRPAHANLIDATPVELSKNTTYISTACMLFRHRAWESEQTGIKLFGCNFPEALQA
jgi:hypothetical protein